MYLIAVFGVLLIVLSSFMVVNPESVSKGIVEFSRKKYFHPFEIASRLAFGVIFIVYAQETDYPGLFSFIGYVLVAVGIGLALTPPSRHRQFAVWSATAFAKVFRPAGVVTIAFGVFVVYVTLPRG